MEDEPHLYFSTPGVQSFNISYYMSDQGDNHQFSPGSTTLPITVEGGGQTLNSSIVVTNPITSIATARTHNTAVANNVYTADGNSIYNFVLGVKLIQILQLRVRELLKPNMSK